MINELKREPRGFDHRGTEAPSKTQSKAGTGIGKRDLKRWAD